MVYGEYKGHTIDEDSVRDLFKKETVLSSDWYADRLKNKQNIDTDLLKKKINNIEYFIKNPVNKSLIQEFCYKERLESAKIIYNYYMSDVYLESLIGTLGAAPIALKQR